jgi:hypothetical protein
MNFNQNFVQIIRSSFFDDIAAENSNRSTTINPWRKLLDFVNILSNPIVANPHPVTDRRFTGILALLRLHPVLNPVINKINTKINFKKLLF